LSELDQHKPWSVGYHSLPYEAEPPLFVNQARLALPYRLIFFGHIDSNRRVEPVLQALEELPDKALFHLDISGSVYNDKELRRQIEQPKLKSILTVHGFATDEILDRALSKVYLVINLCYPTMGKASLSQLRIWPPALLSMVT
jgi:glycosyltransferase involved in cell wall biosynthesis